MIESPIHFKVKFQSPIQSPIHHTRLTSTLKSRSRVATLRFQSTDIHKAVFLVVLTLCP